MKITILTLFPEYFEKFISASIIGRAIARNIVSIEFVNIREFSLDKNHRVDDRPIGGGAGLIMRLEPLLGALNSVSNRNSHKILLSASGTPYSQHDAKRLSKLDEIILVCGHYEGIDARFNDYVDESISIGDYILTGGELSAMVIADSVIRLLEGAIAPESTIEESFTDSLLEYPQYTFPIKYQEKRVPEILLTGNHEAIAYYRHKESLKLTKNVRPDLLKNYSYSKQEKKMLKEIEEDLESKLEITAKEKGARFIK